MTDTSSVGSDSCAGTRVERVLFGEVPVLPVVVPLGGAVLVGSAWHLRRRGLLTAPRAAVALALGVYAAGIVANTVFPIFLDKPASSARWTQFVNVTPMTGYELGDAAMNVCVFVPIGALVPLVVPHWPWWRVLAVATVLSLSIEVGQYATAHLLAGGHVTDVNDLTFNMVGAALGLLVLAALSTAPVVARLIDRFRWSKSAQHREPAGRGSTARTLSGRDST
ncbi:VanZ family protein [Nocardioides sp. 1609]|uniref:VanZ family protein n=1 Tax=Nocardioides sp. 1609 TaxID=2508327 RepID=UPI00106F2BE5|nr:VanZ family protein [Nocardioides sp. 1609]